MYYSDPSLFGFIDQRGILRVPCIYSEVKPFQNGYAAVFKEEIGWGLVDKNGKEMIPCEYSGIAGVGDELVAVEKDGRWGYVNLNNKVIIPFQYFRATAFSEGLAWVEPYNSRGPCVHNYIIIDKNGREKTRFSCEDKGEFSEGVALFRRFLSTPILNLHFKIVVGVVNWQGRILWQATEKTDERSEKLLGKFHNGIAKAYFGTVTVDGKINYLGKYKFNYEDDPELKDGRALYCGKEFFNGYYTQGIYGYKDKIGKIVIPAKYSPARDFSEGVAAVKEQSWGYIDPDGSTAIPFQFKEASSFKEGLARVVTQKGIGNGTGNELYIDHAGRTILSRPSNEYAEADDFHEGMAIIRYGEKYKKTLPKLGEAVFTYTEISTHQTLFAKAGEMWKGRLVKPFASLYIGEMKIAAVLSSIINPVQTKYSVAIEFSQINIARDSLMTGIRIGLDKGAERSIMSESVRVYNNSTGLRREARWVFDIDKDLQALLIHPGSTLELYMDGEWYKLDIFIDDGSFRALESPPN